MNIFWLDKDPVENARMHHDKHVVKMILEYAQLLSTAHRLLDGTQLSTTSASGRKKKVWQLPDHRDSVLYSATHTNHPSAVWARDNYHNYKRLYALFVATCDEYTHRYVVGSYRKYYIDKKVDMAKWTNREPPEWFINGVKEKYANVCVSLQEVRERFRKVPIDRKSKRTRAKPLP